MSGAGKNDTVRMTADAQTAPGGPVIPAGSQGTVLEARADGSCLIEVNLAPRAGKPGGGFVQVLLAGGQYEVVRAHGQEQAAGEERPRHAFEGGSVVFVIGAGRQLMSTYPKPRADALPPRRGDAAMSAVRELDSVRTTVDVEILPEGRLVPAGTEGAVLAVRPDGSCLIDVAFAPQTAQSDGDFDQVWLTAGQYEVIHVYEQG